MLEVRALAKRFSGRLVLDHVSFHVAPGEILAYLGPNGSGKSTTFKILAGLLEPSSGGIFLNGTGAQDDATAFRRQLGYIPEEPELYTNFTAPEYLRLVGRLRDIPARRLDSRIARLLASLELDEAAGHLMSVYSKGMRQRVLLAAALLHDPALLVLDEPFTGLDVHAGLLLRHLLRALARRGKMILLSSHRMDVVETLCPRILILHNGRIVAEGTPANLRAARSASLEEVFAAVTHHDDYAARADAIVDVISPHP